MYSFKKKVLFSFLILVLFVAFDIALNFTLYNPAFITPIYAYVLNKKIIPEESEPAYPLISIKELNSGLYSGPRAMVIGTVLEIIKSGDGDWHINIQGPDSVLVAEVVPEFPVALPTVGEKVKVWGVTRFDLAHRWWELHPVFGIEKAQ